MYLSEYRIFNARHYFEIFGLLRNEGRALFGTDIPPGAGSDRFILAVYKSWDVEKLHAGRGSLTTGIDPVTSEGEETDIRALRIQLLHGCDTRDLPPAIRARRADRPHIPGSP